MNIMKKKKQNYRSRETGKERQTEKKTYRKL